MDGGGRMDETKVSRKPCDGMRANENSTWFGLLGDFFLDDTDETEI